ncbi:hypothetical protein LR48_Vigan585s000700 [Vigna angularis]|uniref:Uncharacterized protein n=1 Tax=Phaseolus angularis TaxID=3914 RepID=A0A0L9TDU6_PHAAN|nr:hypothetical protein LR48_Vigan585s000700 [Vigna angularis]
MEGKLNALERRMAAMVSSMEEVKATVQGMTLEFQRAQERRTKNHHRGSEASRDSVNVGRERRLPENSEEESVFLDNLTRRFGGLNRGTVCEELAAERQEESGNKDIQEFEILVQQTSEEPYHSSLSVSVDLGASVITGVEAVGATKRRSDPSSVMDNQLGLELTVSNNDCPLYDIVINQNNSADGPFDSKRGSYVEKKIDAEILSHHERRVMDWHFAHLESGCADDAYGGFGVAHCMIKGSYSSVVEFPGEGITIPLNHVVTNVSYGSKEAGQSYKVKVSIANGKEFFALNKVTLEFPSVFWEEVVDYFGEKAEGRNSRGHCFMFWNVRKAVGAPVLIVVGDSVPDTIADVVTDWVTGQEHPDNVGGAMMSGLRESACIIDIVSNGNYYVAEMEGLGIKDKLYLFELGIMDVIIVVTWLAFREK